MLTIVPPCCLLDIHRIQTFVSLLFLPLYVKGKCSHGGAFDDTSRTDPVGGISKDDTGSSHGFLHQDAVSLAVNATVELLEDIRLSVGDENFLRC